MNTEPKPDMVNGPKHYRGDRVMCIIEEFGLGFKDGNVIKYVLRYPEKGGVEDLKKARWYLDRLIAEKEGVVEVKPVDPPEDEFNNVWPGDEITESSGKTYKVKCVVTNQSGETTHIHFVEESWPPGRTEFVERADWYARGFHGVESDAKATT